MAESRQFGRGDVGRGDVCETAGNPRRGNYGGSTYKHLHEAESGPEMDAASMAAHEAQTSALAARRGEFMLDYLRARVPDNAGVWRELRGWLGIMTARPFGWRGWYDESYTVLDGGIVAACRDKERGEVEGILIDLPGRACAGLGTRLAPFLRWCLEVGNVTRADFALDDREGLITLPRILEADVSGAIVTRWRGFTLLQNRERGRVAGWTCYFGSRQSQAFVRIYDKAAEQGCDGMHWVRFELECKGAFADALCREYFKRGSVAIVEQVNRRFRIVEPQAGDGNRWRWPVAGWWLAFIGSVQPGVSLLAGEKQETTIESLAGWLENQAGPSLYALVAARGMEPVGDMLGRCKNRLKSKHYAAIAHDKQGAGVPV
jgi:hypothetical protein